MSLIDKKAAVAEYRQLYDGLNRLILTWDPYGLSRAGEINDEFSQEVADILYKLPHCQTERDVILAIRTVFAKSFSEDQFPLSACESIGSSVHSWWSAQS